MANTQKHMHTHGYTYTGAIVIGSATAKLKNAGKIKKGSFLITIIKEENS